MFTDLPISAKTAYAQLQDSVASLEMRRTAASLSGSFNRKSVGGHDYWYYCYRLPGVKGQQAVFVGPDSKRMTALIEASSHPPAGQANIEALVRSYQAMGGTPAIRQHVSLLRHLADVGFFRAGGVLAGTHAFLAYANALGLRWDGHDRTSDVDLGWTDRCLSIVVPASPRVDLHDALTTFENGFVPSSVMDGRLGTAYHDVSDPEFRVDFLTTLTREGQKARPVAALNIVAQPLPFMEFSLETPMQVVIFDGWGRCVLANVPPPDRFAIHKLIVTEYRTAAHRTKVAKDLAQAASLLTWFGVHDPKRIWATRANAMKRGPKWRKALNAGWAKLAKAYPEAVKAF